MTIFQATGANAQTLIAAAQPGDTVQLTGAIPRITLFKKGKAAPGVTIESAPGQRATVAGFWFNVSGGYTVQDLEVTPHPDKKNCVYSQGCSDIYVRRCELHGPAGTRSGQGASFGDQTGYSVEDCEIHDLAGAVGYNGVRNLVIARNKVHDIRGDGLHGYAADVLIEDNFFTDFFKLDGDHCDVVQFWNTKDPDLLVKNITIRRNVWIRGKGTPSQGVFFGDPGPGYENVVIEGNAFIGGSYHGISLYKGRNSRLADNFTQPWNNSLDGGKQMTPWVKAFDPIENVVVEKNVSGPLVAPGNMTAFEAWKKRNDPPVDPKDAAIQKLTADNNDLRTANTQVTAERDTLQAQLSEVNAALKTKTDEAVLWKGKADGYENQLDEALAKITAAKAALD